MGVDPAFWGGRRVLVTGHTGFKGAWLTLWLMSMGARVTGLADTVPAPPSLFPVAGLGDDLAADHRVDVRDAAAVLLAVEHAQPDVVLHLAAQPYVRRSYREPVETYATNVMGTAHVLEAVRTVADVSAVVIVTSDKCYDHRGLQRPFTEDDPMGGHDPYSSSKGAAELVTDAYRRSFFDEHGTTLVASARAGNVIGGGDWGEDRLIPDIIRGALRGERIPIRRPDAVRPWQHVLDPLAGYLVLAQSLAAQDRTVATGFNFGPEPNGAQPVRAVVDGLTARWPEELHWDIDPAPSPHEAAYLALDSGRAWTRLGWAPTWDIAEALDAIVEWFVAYRDGADMRSVSLEQIARFTRS